MWVFSIIVILSFIVFCVEIARCLGRIRRGQPDGRLRQARMRLWHVLKSAFLQGRVRSRWWGWFHLIIFYAFLAFLLGTAEIFIDGFVPGWSFSAWIGRTAYSILGLVETYFAWLGLAAVVVLALRRLRCRSTVYSTFDAWLILGLIGLILSSHIVLISCQMAMFPEVYAPFIFKALPLSSRLGAAFASQGEMLSVVCAGIHLLSVSAFLIWIPRGKHLHIFLVFFALYSEYRGYDRFGNPNLGMRTPDMAQYERALEHAIEADLPESSYPTFGVSRLSDTTRRMRLEAYACTQCKRCTNVCPMSAASLENVQGPLSSMLSLRRLCENGEEEAKCVGNLVSKAELYACTQCGACDAACAVGVFHTSRIVELRRGCMAEEAYPESCRKVFNRFERSGNAWGYPKSDRMKWARDLGLLVRTEAEVIKRGETPENASETAFKRQVQVSKTRSWDSIRRVLIFGGCMCAYDAGARKGLERTVAWLRAQGFEVFSLEREVCCGEPLRKLGDERGYQAMMAENLSRLEKSDHEIVLTLCPHCAHTLGMEYDGARDGRPVMTMVSFLSELWSMGKLSIDARRASQDAHVVMHVPCGLCKRVDSDRLKRFILALGIEIGDEDLSRSHCCGGGGGQFLIRDTHEIGAMRTQELVDFGAESIATACPYCTELLRDGVARIAGKSKTEGDEVKSLIPVFNVVDTILDAVSVRGESCE